MAVIKNEILEISIHERGAELDSIYNHKTGIEYLWNGEPTVWPKKSPVLFPTVGELKNGTYYFEGKNYSLGRHGFAREVDFNVSEQSENSVTFTLISNSFTLAKYPFKFRFDITYAIKENKLSVTYSITNTGNRDLLFSVGGHPAFKLPLITGTAYTDYYLQFERNETVDRWPISKDGLIDFNPTPFLNNENHLPLKKELFLQDALVFKNLQSNKVSLKSPATPHGLEFDFTGFPYLGIWAAKNADFVCIEPWCGIADSVSSDQQLINKEGINELKEAEKFERSWVVSFF